MLNWLITSSADPAKLSLFVRGILTSVLPIAMLALGFTEAEGNALVEGIVKIVFYGSSLLSAAVVVWGLVRKVINKRWSAAN